MWVGSMDPPRGVPVKEWPGGFFSVRSSQNSLTPKLATKGGSPDPPPFFGRGRRWGQLGGGAPVFFKNHLISCHQCSWNHNGACALPLQPCLCDPPARRPASPGVNNAPRMLGANTTWSVNYGDYLVIGPLTVCGPVTLSFNRTGHRRMFYAGTLFYPRHHK